MRPYSSFVKTYAPSISLCLVICSTSNNLMFISFDALKQLKYVKEIIKWSLKSIAFCLFNFRVFKLPSCAFLSKWFISFAWSQEPYDLKSLAVSRWSDLYFDTTLNLWSINFFSAAFNSCSFEIIVVKSALVKLMKRDLLLRNLENILRLTY